MSHFCTRTVVGCRGGVVPLQLQWYLVSSRNPMYEQFYGLSERPFDLTPNPRYLLLTPSHREALANLDYGIASRKGLIVVTGDAGTGKTTLLRRVMGKGISGNGRPRAVHTVYLANPTLERREFVEYLARGFGLSPDAHASKARLLVELEQ